ncbi:Hypothetical predicted protein [Podarcis lilfordi]|uniref:Uncharacterized protein n=1 Tax=Podarcis lilfordi TaxID=74358 RepID=A0AA35NX38_9SAUR|nr:Hypothetical predicted protein [Podarcis lilfordi]
MVASRLRSVRRKTEDGGSCRRRCGELRRVTITPSNQNEEQHNARNTSVRDWIILLGRRTLDNTVAMTAECPPSRRRHLVVDSNRRERVRAVFEAGLGGPSSSAPRPGREKFPLTIGTCFLTKTSEW